MLAYYVSSHGRFHAREVGLTVFFSYGEGVPGALEAGSGHDELGAANLPSSVDYTAQIIVVSLLSVIHAPKYGVG